MIKSKNLKLWQVFYNSNDYLCLIYKIENGRAYIMNYNGTFYTVSTVNGNEYKYRESVISTTAFLEQFPTNKVENWEDRKVVQYIKALRSVKTKNINLLLLC